MRFRKILISSHSCNIIPDIPAQRQNFSRKATEYMYNKPLTHITQAKRLIIIQAGLLTHVLNIRFKYRGYSALALPSRFPNDRLSSEVRCKNVYSGGTVRDFHPIHYSPDHAERPAGHLNMQYKICKTPAVGYGCPKCKLMLSPLSPKYYSMNSTALPVIFKSNKRQNIHGLQI